MLGVHLEGGLVQSVITDEKELEGKDAVVIDYDTEGADEFDLIEVPQSDGSVSEAFVGLHTVEKSQIDLKAVYNAELKSREDWNKKHREGEIIDEQ